MLRRKEDTEENSGSMRLALLAAVISILGGSIFSAALLILGPVKKVTVLPGKETLNGQIVYFVEGASGAGGNWKNKRQIFLTQQIDRLPVTESELNQWASSQLRKEIPAGKSDTILGMRVSGLNFRILDGELQLGGYLSVPKNISRTPITIQAKGKFVDSKNGPTFKMESGLIGKAPIGNIPGVNVLLTKIFMQYAKYVSEVGILSEEWGELKSIELEEDLMYLVRG